MTSLSLLLWILLGIGLQLAIFLAVSFWRHWQVYLALKAGLTDAPPHIHHEPEQTRRVGPESWAGFRALQVARKVSEDAAGSVCSFYFTPEDGKPLPAFLPGQFLTFRLHVPAAAGGTEALVRCYSLSDAPAPESYRVTIKRVGPPPGTEHPPGRSSNYFHDLVEVGTSLQVRAPSGHFFLDPGETPVVLVAGGIGITPLLSMLNWSLAEQPGREIWLFYGVRDGREAIMGDHLAALAAAHPNFHPRLCYSQPRPDDQLGRDYHHRGRVDVTLFRLELPLKPFHFFVCGPTSMMESLIPALEDWGVPPDRIHFEAFGPASISRRQTAPAPIDASRVMPTGEVIQVNFAKTGRQLAWTPGITSLLELAEANGIGVDSGCRAGSCGTCQTRIKDGEVVYRQPPDYDPEPGTCLLCLCTPKTHLTLEA